MIFSLLFTLFIDLSSDVLCVFQIFENFKKFYFSKITIAIIFQITKLNSTWILSNSPVMLLNVSLWITITSKHCGFLFKICTLFPFRQDHTNKNPFFHFSSPICYILALLYISWIIFKTFEIVNCCD